MCRTEAAAVMSAIAASTSRRTKSASRWSSHLPSSLRMNWAISVVIVHRAGVSSHQRRARRDATTPQTSAPRGGATGRTIVVGLFSDAIETRLPALPVAALASAGDRWWLRSVRGRRVRERRGALAADDRGCLVYEIVVLERLDHEQREVDAARDVASEDGVPDVAAPHRQALADALFQPAAPHDGPAGVAGEDAPRGLDLVVEVGEAGEPGQAPADLDERPELPRVDVPAVARDVPPTREHQPCPRRGEVEHRLRRPGRVPVHAARDEDDQYTVAAGHGPLDDVAVVGRA